MTSMAPSGESSAAAGPPVRVAVREGSTLALGQFVKLAGLADTGGEAKQLVMAGLVRVNGSVEIHRGRKLVSGDIVEVRGRAREVAVERSAAPRG